MGDGKIILSNFPNLAESISTASIYPSTTNTIISLASFLQCLHMHQLRFPILICNKSQPEA